MGIMKAIGDILSPNDPELVEKTLSRLVQQDQWNDVFSTVLLEMLEGNDSLKAEIRKSLREAKGELNRAQQLFKTISVASISVAAVCLLAVTWMGYSFSHTTPALTAATILSALIVIGAGRLVAEVRREK
jgi:hypothetical protein